MKKLLILLVVFLNVGCSKFLTDYSQDLVIVKTTTDLDELMLGSAYLESKELNAFVGGRNASPFLNFLDDDINSVVGTTLDFQGGWEPWINPYIYGFTTWQLDVSRSYDKSEVYTDDLTWLHIYNRINIVNMVLAELDNVARNTDAEKLAAVRIEGEALFLRAQYYLLLSNLYGDAYNPANADVKLTVPLKLTEFVEHKGNTNLQFTRATAKEMYAQIVEDLKRSVACFDESPQIKKLYRVSGPASQLLLSRVYLYMQDWENAYNTASEFVGKNSVLTNLNIHKEETPLITKDNREVIFSHGNLNLQNVLTAHSDDFCVSNDLYSLYQEEDLRKNIYFAVQDQTDSVSLNNKYIRGTHRSHISDIFMLRNAEGYLNLAEAAAMLGSLNEASVALNTLRNSRISNYIPGQFDANTIVDEIRIERRKELCFEGHRWFDLRRYAVNQIHPYSKDIIRYYSAYDMNKRALIQTEIYRLPAGDPAYTFALPKSVIEFESGLVNNPRNVREYEALAD
ncbi:RagB/SusD family nutrient uptake outer membrane protein [Sphingobacterium bovistauri]|uniref:RagB/SusD family nutrient uptake outer membrane protein n=1 Tax=Sphingobacterium bovistauri TaxID=2781959 RepID=A0ABS7Z830_9SPHI|nr:RagB/SusD family nutrient uptake outer membrane protein [Sphingobacterium bovistauri]MCA5006345.1 RagB/SusD family nutrient uptake outer membrane protein [Sphingobacterium bovistauri]